MRCRTSEASENTSSRRPPRCTPGRAGRASSSPRAAERVCMYRNSFAGIAANSVSSPTSCSRCSASLNPLEGCWLLRVRPKTRPSSSLHETNATTHSVRLVPAHILDHRVATVVSGKFCRSFPQLPVSVRDGQSLTTKSYVLSVRLDAHCVGLAPVHSSQIRDLHHTLLHS